MQMDDQHRRAPEISLAGRLPLLTGKPRLAIMQP